MGQVAVRITGETESGKAYKATVAVASKRMAEALAGITQKEIFLPKSAITKDADGNPQIDAATGNALSESWGLRGKLKHPGSVLIGARAAAIVERAREAVKVGCLSLVEETESGGLRVAAEAPDNPKGRQYIAFLARETNHPESYRVIRTDQPVTWKPAAVIDSKGEPKLIDAITLDDLPAHSLFRRPRWHAPSRPLPSIARPLAASPCRRILPMQRPC